MFSAGLFIPAADGSQGHVSSHAERLQDLPLSRKCNVTRYFVGGVAVQVRAHSPCSGGLVCGISASRRLSEATRPLSESLWQGQSLPAGFFAVFGVMGGVSSPTARSPLQSPTGPSWESRRSTSDPGSEVLWRDSGEAPVRPAGRSGAGLAEYGARGSAV
jgi:hypothetical protein